MSVNYISYGLYILYADDSLEAALIINYLSLEVVKLKVSFNSSKVKFAKISRVSQLKKSIKGRLFGLLPPTTPDCPIRALVLAFSLSSFKSKQLQSTCVCSSSIIQRLNSGSNILKKYFLITSHMQSGISFIMEGFVAEAWQYNI